MTVYSEIRSNAFLRAGISEDDGKFTAERMTRITNMALQQVSAEFDPWWLLSTYTLPVVAGTTLYATSAMTRFYKVHRITDDLSYDLAGLSSRELSRFVRYPGKPTGYLVEGGYIKLGPRSDAAYTYTVFFYQYEAPLSADGDQPLLPTIYTDFLVVKMAMIMAQINKDPETAAILAQEYKDWKARIAGDIRQMTANPRIVLREEDL